MPSTNSELISSRLGLDVDAGISVSAARGKALRYVLANEFRSDLTGGPPSSLSMIPTPATKEHLDRIREVGSRMRAAHATAYEAIADKVETELGLRTARIDAAHLGSIDTFRFENRRCWLMLPRSL